MKFRSLLILILLMGGLGTYIYYGIQKPAEQKAADGPGDKLYTFKADELEALKIENSNLKIELSKTDKTWRITSPIQDVASNVKMKTVLSALEKLKKMKELQKTELEGFGLKPARLTIDFKKSGNWQQLLLGNQNPSASAVYAQTAPGAKIVLVGLDLDFLATQKIEDFREMNLTTVESEKFDLVKLEAAGRTLVFKKEGGAWKLSEPAGLPADTEAIRNLAEKLSLIRANTFLEKAPTSQKPDIRVSVGFQEGISDLRTDKNDTRPLGIQIDLLKVKEGKLTKAGAAPNFVYYAKGDKTPWATISQFHFENLMKKPEDFVRKTFDDFLVSEVSKASYKLPGTSPIELERNEKGYQVSKAKDTKAGNQTRIEDSLRSLRSLRALNFLEIVKQPPPLPSLTAHLVLKNGEARDFALELKKDNAALYVLYQTKWLKFVTAKNPIRVEDFDYPKLTENSATPVSEKKAEDSSEKKE